MLKIKQMETFLCLDSFVSKNCYIVLSDSGYGRNLFLMAYNVSWNAIKPIFMVGKNYGTFFVSELSKNVSYFVSKAQRRILSCYIISVYHFITVPLNGGVCRCRHCIPAEFVCSACGPRWGGSSKQAAQSTHLSTTASLYSPHERSEYNTKYRSKRYCHSF